MKSTPRFNVACGAFDRSRVAATGRKTRAMAALRAASMMARRVGEGLHFITFARTLDYCNNSNPHC
jgi:hypothetical protein